MSPELQRRKTIDLLAQWTLSLSEVQPLVLFVEDLHWCDVSTLEFLGHVIAQSPTARVLLLATARPEFTAPWPALQYDDAPARPPHQAPGARHNRDPRGDGVLAT